MMEVERGVKGVEGRLLYECDMIGRTGRWCVAVSWI